MKVDLDYLRNHYASLPDDELLEIDPDDLVEAARQCFDEELKRRQKTQSSFGAHSGAPDPGEEDQPGEEPDWLEEAASAYVFLAQPGTHRAPAAQQAASVLRAAGIPVYLSTQTVDSSDPAQPPQLEYHVLVPGDLSLLAVSVLDKEIFNAPIEATWRAYFESLSDEQLQTADTEMLFAGFVDRLERVTKAYDDEIRRRGLDDGAAPDDD